MNNIQNVPDYVHKYTPKIARQWSHVYTTIFTKTQDNSRATRAANSVLKKRFDRTKSFDRNGKDNINHLVDTWLGNLIG